MKLIIIDRNRLALTLIILGLMAVMLGAGNKFDERLKATVLMDSDIRSMIKYEGLDRRFSYSLPGDWQASLKDFGSSEILYHNDFKAKNQPIHGFVQVWNLKEDLKSFLEKSKENSGALGKVNYKNYMMEPVTINGFNGYLVSYSMDVGKGIYYKGYEYYLGYDEMMFRFSFFVSEANFKETMPTIFNLIVKTFHYDK